MRRYFFIFSCVCGFLGRPVVAADKSKQVGIIGDSLATGAVTSPALFFDAGKLWRVFSGQDDIRPRTDAIADAATHFNISEPIPAAPRRLWPSGREFSSFYEWVALNFIGSVSRLVIDTEEYSWGYLFGRGLHAAPEDILIAAENGARSEQAILQVQRLLVATEGELPGQIAMLFAGNDLCSYAPSASTTGAQYAKNLQLAIEYALRNRSNAEAPLTFTVVAPLATLQLVDAPLLLDKQIFAHGKFQTCRELHQHQAAMQVDESAASGSLLATLITFLPASPIAYCHSLFPPSDPAARGEHLAFLGNRLRSFRDATRSMIEQLQKQWAGKQPVQIRWIEQTSALQFKPEDIGNDCFHLSAAGQAKLAKTILDNF